MDAVRVVDFHCEGWVKFRRLVVCPLEGRANVRSALQEAAREFEKLFDGRAQYGFMKKLPKGIESGVEVGDLMLFEAEWMLERCVAVGCKAPLSPSTATSPQMRTSAEFGERA